MQTFLPYPDFVRTAKCLDRQRLNKQRVETRQILETLSGLKNGWRHHPAVKLWAGHENWLVDYGICICAEWRERGYTDRQDPIIASFYRQGVKQKAPFWLGDEEFHQKHRATLLFKNFEWYKQFGWMETPKYEYKWPV